MVGLPLLAMPARGRPQQYETHFYCALCGGPFSHVYRTAERAQAGPAGVRMADDDAADTTLDSEFNVAAGDNRVVPEEVVLEGMGHAARRARDQRQRSAAGGQRRGMLPEPRTVRAAYDGRRLGARHMTWLRSLRALVHTRARNHPLGYREFLDDGQLAYLTGRGLVRCDENWADAFASIEADESEHADAHAHHDVPVFSDRALENNTFGFHLYQELGREGLEFFVSAIPFHDECWSLLDLATEVSGIERGLSAMNEKVSVSDLWDHLRSLVGVSGTQKVTEQTCSLLRQGTNRRDVVTRLGEVDYREAEASGEGWQWKHEDGCHWLAADPSLISVLNAPLKTLPQTYPYSCAPRAALSDPFNNLPTEVILEICGLLSSADICCLKIASPAIQNVALPESFFRRFLRDEFRYLPSLLAEIQSHEKALRRGKPNNIDWRGSFIRLRRLIKTPDPPFGPDESNAAGWDKVDIGLKNRNRIWKIVKPIAEEIVETSSTVLRCRYGAPKHLSERISVVRGYLGVRSGREGLIETAYVGSRGKSRARPQHPEDSDDEEKDARDREDVVAVKVWRTRIWTDGSHGPFCGIAFEVRDAELGASWRRLGRKGSDHVDLSIDSRNRQLAGFVLCLSGQIISGVQVAFEGSSQNNSEITFSARFGRWTGPVRKIIVPSYWRKFVGVTGFVNTAGFIETIGLLEETKMRSRHDAFGPLATPPPKVDLSHEEASLWTRLPPKNVRFLEREGIIIPDWRLCGADWEVWESGYHEEGQEVAQQAERRHLKKIVGYFDPYFLRGLQFVYEGEQTATESVSVMGTLEGKFVKDITFQKGESVIAAVISFGNAAVHGVLFVTDRGRASEVFGPPYKGTHKVFAPAPDQSLSYTAYREEIMSKIIGLHCLYDHHSKRFLQLGLMLPPSEDCIFGQPLPRPIPFDELDDQVAVWSDRPPPKEWIFGYNIPNSVYVDGGSLLCDTIAPDPQFPDYTDWAEVKNLRTIKVYGRMRGIRFSWTGGGNEKYFGNTCERQQTRVQNIDSENGEYVVGLAIIDDGDGEVNPKDTDPKDNASVQSASSVREVRDWTGSIFFLTNWNIDNVPHPIKTKLYCPLVENNLVAVKFDFATDRLLGCRPIYAPKPGQSRKEVSGLIRYPWRKYRQNIVADGEVPDTTRVACTFFDDEGSDSGTIDAVKGYVTFEGRFCGLTFRRHGKWSKEVFGQASAYETTMELQPGEYFTSLCLPEINGKPSPEAVALCTNYGNASPWFGISGRPNVRFQHCKPPRGHIAVGLWGALVERPYYFGTYLWNSVGLLYRPQDKDTEVATPPETPRPQQSGFHETDKNTGLPWLSDPSNAQNLYLRPLVARQFFHYQESENVGHAHCVFEPSQLLQLRVYGHPRGNGIRSIRFRGTAEMGLATLGDWPAEDVLVKSHHKMSIAGPQGERITRITVYLQRLEDEDRICVLYVETSFGRTGLLVSCRERPVPEKLVVNFNPNNAKVLECGPRDEVVGLHGIVSNWTIHDLGFIVRKENTPTPSKSPVNAGTATTAVNDAHILNPSARPQRVQCLL